jgi:ATP-dependent DNA ligase
MTAVRDLHRPIPPMEALLVSELPLGPEWQYEPKWDGFRCIAFRDGNAVELQSKSGKPLTRYFPEIVAALAELTAKTFVLDGEIVVPVGTALSFDDLLQRIHPAASRIKKLAEEHPARYIIFDLLADARGKSLLKLPLKDRRPALEEFAGRFLEENERLVLSWATTDPAVAKKWLSSEGADVDGIIAKRLDFDYRSGDRTGMQKVKWARTADCVVGGFRYATNSTHVGSLLLGLYDNQGLLHHVGFCSAIKTAERAKLTAKLKKLIKPPGFTGRAPGGPSRWSTERSAQWEPLAPKLVVEVSFDHVTGERFRHGTGFVRWRPDKAPKQCKLEQLYQKRVPV